MRHLIFSLTIVLCGNLFAQSPDPVITGDTMLCPNGSGTLSTTETYDSYQWYVMGYFDSVWSEYQNNGQQQTINIDENDVLNYFKVEVVANGDTATSDSVLVDQWAFLPPVVSTNGDFTTGPNGEAQYCAGDTLYFVLLAPYDTNITWYRNGNIIPNENDDTLFVDAAGDYTVSGAPKVCPDYIQQLGPNITVIQFTPKQPEIVQSGDTLIVQEADSFSSITWYKDGEKISGASDSIYVPSSAGNFYVETTDENDCQSISNTISYTPTGITHPETDAISIYPNPASDVVNLKLGNEQAANVDIYNSNGRLVETRNITNEASIEIGELAPGVYLVKVRWNDQIVTGKFMKE